MALTGWRGENGIPRKIEHGAAYWRQRIPQVVNCRAQITDVVKSKGLSKGQEFGNAVDKTDEMNAQISATYNPL